MLTRITDEEYADLSKVSYISMLEYHSDPEYYLYEIVIDGISRVRASNTPLCAKILEMVQNKENVLNE